MDLIAFETIPRIDEADAILTALEEVLQEDGQGKLATAVLPPVYISFVFPLETEGRFLPYPRMGARAGPRAIVELIQKRKAGINWPIAGVGINCTKTNILKGVLDFFAQGALEEPRQSQEEKLHLFVSGPEVLGCIGSQMSCAVLTMPLRTSVATDVPRRRTRVGCSESMLARPCIRQTDERASLARRMGWGPLQPCRGHSQQWCLGGCLGRRMLHDRSKRN